MSAALTALGGWLLLDGLLWTTVAGIAVATAKGKSYRVGPDDPAGDAAVTVSIVIPARNEAHNIVGCVQAALSQDHPAVQVVVLDDGSTDGTTELLSGIDDPRLTVVAGGGEGLPDGWLGKPWACQRAARHATGQWLLFVDADVRLAPEAVSRSLFYVLEHQLDALSGMGTLEVRTLGEKVMQPVVAGLLLAGNGLSDVNDPEQPDKALANGQFILVSRSAYDAVDGHGAVARDVLDDVGMARALKGAGKAYHLVFMRRLFRCRMYDGLADLWAGWRKNLFPGLRWSWVNLTVLVVGQLVVVVLPYLALFAALVGGGSPLQLAVAAFPVLAIQSVRFYLDGVFGQSRLVGLLTHGVANIALVLLLLDSAVSTTLGWATWKGRVLPKPE